MRIPVAGIEFQKQVWSKFTILDKNWTSTGWPVMWGRGIWVLGVYIWEGGMREGARETAGGA